MDPYLEGEIWQEFHDRLANQISAQLLPLVAPRYVALLGKRCVFDAPA
jgi:NADPH-dependent 7-cyano-7-deazaguanine reductase QueF